MAPPNPEPASRLTPDSRRYFDHHDTAENTLDKVIPRELHLAAAALAPLFWLVDTQRRWTWPGFRAFRLRDVGRRPWITA